MKKSIVILIIVGVVFMLSLFGGSFYFLFTLLKGKATAAYEGVKTDFVSGKYAPEFGEVRSVEPIYWDGFKIESSNGKTVGTINIRVDTEKYRGPLYAEFIAFKDGVHHIVSLADSTGRELVSLDSPR